MTIQRMIELLEVEHECMLRGAHDDCDRDCANCELVQDDGDLHKMYTDVIALLKEQEAAQPKTIPEELKQKMWNALYAEEDKLEKKYVGAEEDGWFFIYRPWLQKGFNIAIEAIANWEGR